MPHINLLPWREEQRQESKKKFVTILIAIVIVCFASMYLLSSFYGALKDGQNLKNSYLSAEINKLDKRITDIRDLDKKKRTYNKECV